MRDQLPAWLDVHRLAPGFELEGSLRLTGLDDWPAGESSVALRLEVAQASSGRLQLVGQLSGQAELECQRCLQAMPYEWESDFRLELVDSEASAQRVDNEVDVYVAEQGRVRLHDLVREESVLALPMMPRHPEGSCQPPGQTSID